MYRGFNERWTAVGSNNFRARQQPRQYRNNDLFESEGRDAIEELQYEGFFGVTITIDSKSGQYEKSIYQQFQDDALNIFIALDRHPIMTTEQCEKGQLHYHALVYSDDHKEIKNQLSEVPHVGFIKIQALRSLKAVTGFYQYIHKKWKKTQKLLIGQKSYDCIDYGLDSKAKVKTMCKAIDANLQLTRVKQKKEVKKITKTEFLDAKYGDLYDRDFERLNDKELFFKNKKEE